MNRSLKDKPVAFGFVTCHKVIYQYQQIGHHRGGKDPAGHKQTCDDITGKHKKPTEIIGTKDRHRTGRVVILSYDKVEYRDQDRQYQQINRCIAIMVGHTLLVDIVEIATHCRQAQILCDPVIAYIEMGVCPFADRRKHTLDQHIIKSDKAVEHL